MNIRFATDSDQTQWNTFVFASPQSSFLQSWEWGQMHKLLGHAIWRLVVEDAGMWQAVALVLKRELPLGRSWLYVPRGPVVAVGEVEVWRVLQEKLEELGRQEKALFIRIDPPSLASGEATGDKSLPDLLKQGGWTKSEREVQPQHTLLLKLAPSEDELLKNMHSKTRYNIRLAQRKGVTVRFASSLDSVEVFLELSRDVESRSGFHFHPDNYYRAMLSALAPAGMLEVAIAEYQERPLAAHIMVYAGNVATYTHGASSSLYRALMGPTLLYWETIRWAKEKGLRMYDFFGIAPADANMHHPWAGITRIKEGFSGKRVSYIGAYDLVLDENFYGLVNTVRRVKKLWR